MNESCCYQDTSAEMFAGKEGPGRNLHPLDSFGNNWETGSYSYLLVTVSVSVGMSLPFHTK